MIPRMLRPTTHRDLRVELFGHKLESPLLIAPVGVQTIFHIDKELGVAEIAAEIGVPYILSTASSSSIEDVAKASGDGVRFFQLYWPQDDDITVSVRCPDICRPSTPDIIGIALAPCKVSWLQRPPRNS